LASMCGTNGAEVATLSSSSTGSAASGPRSVGRIMRSVGFLQTVPPSGGAVRSESVAPCRVERRGTTLRASRRVPYCNLPRKWSPPNERAGSPSVATSMTRAVGSSVERRVSRRVSVGAAVRSELFGARADVLPGSSGIRVGEATSAQAGVEGGAGRSNRWLPMRGEGQLRPSLIRRQSRAGVGRKPRVGEAAQVVCGGSYSGDATTSLSRIRAAAPRVGQSRRFRCRQRRRKDSVQRQWRRAFAPKPVAPKTSTLRGVGRKRSGEGASASSRGSEGRGPPGNRSEGHRRSASVWNC
jgi:hypothetical protein